MTKRVEKHTGQSDAQKHGRRFIDPEFARRRRAEAKAAQERYDELCGPVEVRKLEGR